LPTARNERLNGTLYYNPDEDITLELFGDFDEIGLISIALNEYDIILGLTSDSKEITLYKSFSKSKDSRRLVNNQEIGTPTTRYSVRYVLEGIHIDRPEDIKFDMLKSEYINLDEWIGISGFDFDIDEEIERTKHHRECQIKYRFPEPITFTLSDDLEGQFNFYIKNLYRNYLYQKIVTLEQKVLFVMKYKEERTLDIILEDLFKFQCFLVLALYEKTTPKNIQLYNENYKKDHGNNLITDREVKLFTRVRKCNTPQKMFINMLFSYKDIKDIFPEIIKNWFDKYKDFELVFNLLVEQFYNDVFTTDTFLSLARTAESFHAHSGLNIPQRPKTKDDILWEEEILNSVDEKHHDRLKGLFDNINNSNLYTRLKEIVDFCSCEALDKIIGDKNTFITQVKNSRHYYTHYSTDREKYALTGMDLIILTQRLKLVLTCTFLIEVGIDKTVLNKMLSDKMYNFSYLIPRMNQSSTALESK